MSTDLEQGLRAARKALPEPGRASSSLTEARVVATVAGGAGSERQRSARPPRLLVLAAVFAVVLGAVGFGVGRWIGPPSGSAATPVAEFAPGFSPAQGWNTVSTGITTPPQAPTAIASNVPFASQPGGTGNLPNATINGLSGGGIVIFVTLFPRSSSSSIPARSLPLQLSDATLNHGFEGISARIADESLQVGVGSWDIDVQAFFGTGEPTQAQLTAAQQELDRLVIPTS